MMNALQDPLDSPSMGRKSSPRRHRSLHPQGYSHGAVAMELTAKIIVNSLLSAAAIVTLIKLIPYQLSQQIKLREVNLEVEETEKRVNLLRENFRRNFDPQQSKKVMQEQSTRVDPQQRRIIFLEPSPPKMTEN